MAFNSEMCSTLNFLPNLGTCFRRKSEDRFDEFVSLDRLNVLCMAVSAHNAIVPLRTQAARSSEMKEGKMDTAGESDTMFDDDIFVSYSHLDGVEFARKLAQQLQNRGFRTWFDVPVLRIGDRLYARIVASLN